MKGGLVRLRTHVHVHLPRLYRLGTSLISYRNLPPDRGTPCRINAYIVTPDLIMGSIFRT